MKNRRNYYRILQVQPDAAPDVIKASYRTLMQKLKLHPDLGGDEWNSALLNEAYSVLSDSTRRATYDAEQRSAMMDVDAIPHSLNVKARPTGSTHQQPCAPHSQAKTTFEAMRCVLCHQLTNVATALPGPRRCHACRSPLTPVDSIAPNDSNKRALPRLERRAAVRYLRPQIDGYGKGDAIVYHARLEDLSPQGMRFSTSQALSLGELLRIECELLSAVAHVVVSRASSDTPAHFIVGTEFITVDFAQQQGSLFEKDA